MTQYEKAVALWQGKHLDTAEKLAEALNGRSIAFTYHSCKIENKRVTYNVIREIFEHDGVTAYTGDLRTLFEIHNAKAANELFLDAFEEKRPFTVLLLKEFQNLLTQNTYDTRRRQLGERPGEFKRHVYLSGRCEIGAAPEDVQEAVDKLLVELQEVEPEKALNTAAYFHAKLESIQPFAAGNGRTARLMMNYFLVLHGHPPIIIHKEDRKAYYTALRAWDAVQQLEPLIAFLKEQTAKTWAKQIEQAVKNGEI